MIWGRQTTQRRASVSKSWSLNTNLQLITTRCSLLNKMKARVYSAVSASPSNLRSNCCFCDRFHELTNSKFSVRQIITSSCTKKTKWFPSYRLQTPPFPVFQVTLVLPPKAANDLLMGLLFIAGFIPPACLLVRNHLFYIPKKWLLLVFEVVDSREERKHSRFQRIQLLWWRSADCSLNITSPLNSWPAQRGDTDVLAVRSKRILNVESSIPLVSGTLTSYISEKPHQRGSAFFLRDRTLICIFLLLLVPPLSCSPRWHCSQRMMWPPSCTSRLIAKPNQAARTPPHFPLPSTQM